MSRFINHLQATTVRAGLETVSNLSDITNPIDGMKVIQNGIIYIYTGSQWVDDNSKYISYDTSSNKLQFHIDSSEQPSVNSSVNIDPSGYIYYLPLTSSTGGKYSQTGGDITVQNTTTSTSIINTGAGDLIFNTLTPGDNYHIRISGDIEKDGTSDEILFEVKLGNEVVSTTTFIDLDSVNGLFPFELEIDFTVRTYGSNCEIVSNSQFVYNTNSGENDYRGWSSNTSSTLDSTISNTMTATVQWKYDKNNNKVRIIQFLVTKTF